MPLFWVQFFGPVLEVANGRQDIRIGRVNSQLKWTGLKSTLGGLVVIHWTDALVNTAEVYEVGWSDFTLDQEKYHCGCHYDAKRFNYKQVREYFRVVVVVDVFFSHSCLDQSVVRFWLNKENRTVNGKLRESLFWESEKMVD